MVIAIEDWVEELSSKKIEDHDLALAIAESIFDKAKQQQETAIKFQRQLENIIANIEEAQNFSLLSERMRKAIEHFTKAIYNELILPLHHHIEKISKQKKVKQYLVYLNELQNILWAKLELVFDASYHNVPFNEGLELYNRKPVIKPAGKLPPGATRLETLKQFTGGRTIEEIALTRNLTIGTIENHLADCIGVGDIELSAVLDPKLISIVLPEVEKDETASLSDIKNRFGDAISFSQVRMVLMHVKNKKQIQDSRVGSGNS